MDTANLQAIRESFGRVVYSHKTHEKDCEMGNHRARMVKWTNVILTTLTSSSLVTDLFSQSPSFLYISTILAATTLAFVIFQVSFNPEEAAEKHRQAAKEIWYVREKYVSLLVDIKNGALSNEAVTKRRDGLIEELKLIYKFVPPTSASAYKKAQRALKINEELTFTNDEINQFLPEDLWIKT
jgi:hypothetical protein